MRLAFRIALRFLRSSIGQTIAIVFGIGIGVSVQVFIGSLITGLQASLIDKTIGSSSQITIEKKEDRQYIENYDEYISYIDAVDNVAVVSTVLQTGSVLISGDASKAIVLRGMDFTNSERIYDFSGKLLEGRLPESDFEVLIGSTLFEELGLSLGDGFQTYMPPAVSDGIVDRYHDVTIVGVFDFKVTSINDSWIVTTIPTVRQILNVGDVVSGIETQLYEVFASDVDAQAIAAAINDPTIAVVDWQSQNASLLSGLNGQTYSSVLIQVFVTLSVVLGIASVLAITVLQKSRQVGILKAMGIKDSQASFIFLAEGMILGVFGAIVGLSIGLGLLYAFTTFALNADGTPVVPLTIDPGFLTLSALIAFLAASIASLIPARRSTRISIIEVIKNG
jgi:lipoprotein-releasing system permease protein